MSKFRIDRKEDLVSIGNNILSFDYNLTCDFESDILSTNNYIKQLVSEHLYLFDQMCKDFTLNKQSFLNPYSVHKDINHYSNSNMLINNSNDRDGQRKTTFNPSNVNPVYPLNLDNLETRTVSTISRSNVS